MAPLERITITEEVQKNGQIVTEERETLQYTEDPVEVQTRELAKGLVHGNIVLPQDRVYTYDEELGMSTSRPRAEAEASETSDEPEETEEEDYEEESEEEDSEEGDEEPENFQPCDHPVGSGSCILPFGHSGSHRLTPVEG